MPRHACLPFLFALAALAHAADTIFIDQIGYRPDDPKTVVFSQPQTGQNAPSTFTPGTSFEVRKASDSSVVLTGTVSAWKSGQTHSQSGDKAWSGDFSSLKTPGRYFIQVASGAKSPEFSIANGVYNDLLRVAVKTFYFQRCGTAIDSAHGDKWTHGVCHVGTGQDTQARLYDGSAQGDPVDVSGGWHDAGDCRKYVPFAFAPLWELLTAAEWYPGVFPDSTGIPESGNGVPDLLDEVKRELDWVLKMQRSDGSVHATVGVLASNNDDGKNPDQQTATRYVTGVNSPAASTLAMAAAKAARLFSAYESVYPGYAALLRTRAELAWSWLEIHPSNVRYNHSGFAQADANTDNAEDLQRRVAAAAALWRLTGESKYRVYLENNYNSAAAKSPVSKPAKPNNDMVLPDSPSLAMGLMDYAATPGADATVVSEFKNAVRNFVDGQLVGNATSSADPYRAYVWDGYYSWGSNLLKSRWAYVGLWAKRLGIATNGTDYAAPAQDYLHYLLGVNPLGWVYLTNLGPKGANLGVSNSLDEVYHSWFADKTIYDGLGGSNLGPAPGFLAGGPNQFYASNTTSGGGTPATPPANQPLMKSYRNWNTSWPDSSWSVTEPAIYYQTSFIFLMAAYADEVVAFTTQPQAEVRLAVGGTLSLTAAVDETDGPATYRWYFEGAPIAGNASALTSNLEISAAAITDTGAYTCVAANPTGSASSRASYVWVEHNGGSGASLALKSLSTRSYVGTGYDIQIAGIALAGSGSKKLVLRASGPGLAQFGVPGTVVDPVVELYSGSTLLATNDDWSGANPADLSSLFTSVGAFQFPEASLDSALATEFAPGNYTLQVRGKNDTTGVALVEAYDTDTAIDSLRLTGLSTRATVRNGAGPLIGGFAVGGASPRTFLIRASGPALALFGVQGTLSQPKLELYRLGNPNILLATNEGWASDPSEVGRLKAAFGAAGVFRWADGSADCALLTTLPPGNYTANISGRNSTEGVALIEVYDMP
jgi:hypothetical protein